MLSIQRRFAKQLIAQVVEEFKNDAKVAFGDVVLQESGIRSIHGTDQSAGAGGWPTIRYYNKETGYGGGAYTKKTSDAMCTELLNMEVGRLPLCVPLFSISGIAGGHALMRTHVGTRVKLRF